LEASNTPINATFVTAMVKGGSDGFALLGGDATQSDGLKKLYEGPRPPGYQPMKKEGAIILGIGGDSSDWAIGTFYEGVMTTGYATDATTRRSMQTSPPPGSARKISQTAATALYLVNPV